MEKKKYEFPRMEIVEIKGLCSILAGSDPNGNEGGGDGSWGLD